MSDEWSQEDEHRRADLEHMLARMEQDWFERGVEAAETSAARTDSGDLPMPNTAHPALAQYAEMVRGVDRAEYAVRLPVVRRITATFDPQPFPTDAALAALTLQRRKAAAPAPFVGDPRRDMACYTWRVWTDDYGRHITTDAELVWR